MRTVASSHPTRLTISRVDVATEVVRLVLPIADLENLHIAGLVLGLRNAMPTFGPSSLDAKSNHLVVL